MKIELDKDIPDNEAHFKNDDGDVLFKLLNVGMGMGIKANVKIVFNGKKSIHDTIDLLKRLSAETAQEPTVERVYKINGINRTFYFKYKP